MAKVDKNLLSLPSVNIGAGKIPTYDSKLALFSGGLIVEDEYNDTVQIWAKDQDFSNMPLYILNITNFDGKAGRKESNLLVSSINNDITGTLKVTNEVSSTSQGGA